jgi:anaerobic dimethyl sulfoxide reductase subunit A
MAYVMITEELYDRNFIDLYTTGFDPFSDYVLGKEDGTAKTPAWAQKICGTPADAIIDLARDYARMKPAALMPGWAPGRSAFGEQFHRATAVLAAITGNWGVPGGYASGGADIVPNGLILSGIPVPKIKHNRVHVTKVYDAILKGKSGEYPADCKLLYIVGSNMLNQYPNLNKGLKAFNVPEFIVVHDLFMTPTARFADMVLPVTHFFEQEDVIQPYIGGSYRIHMDKVLDAPDGPRSDLSIFTELSQRVGMEEYNDKSDDEWLKFICESMPDMPDLESFRQEKIQKIETLHPYIAFKEQMDDPENHPFPTPSGKIEIFSEMFDEMKDENLPPIPKYIPSWEGVDDTRRLDYPIQLVTPHSRARVNSQFYTIPQMNTLADDRIWLNSKDALERKISDGDKVVVHNDRGKLTVKARVTDHILGGVASLDQGAWYDPDENDPNLSGCVNVLTLDEMSPVGAFPYNTCLVEIQKK